MKRLFIEVHKTNEHNKWELDDSVDTCQELSGIKGNDFFWKIIDNARFEPNLFEYIKEADEIYMSTAIIPLVHGTDIGSPELWNSMMQAAIKHNITGKKIFNQREYGHIQWDNLDKKLLDGAFKKNYLYVMDTECEKWEQVDVDTLLREKFKK